MSELRSYFKGAWVFIVTLVAITTVFLSLILYLFTQYKKISWDEDAYAALSLIATSLASIGTLILLFFTLLTFMETRKQRIAQEEPAITLRMHPDSKTSNLLNLHLRNSGGSPAYDLTVKFDPDLPYGDSTLNQLPMLKRMPLLDKGEDVSFLYDSAIEYFATNNPRKSTAHVTYYTLPKNSRFARKKTRSFEVDFEERMGQMNTIKRDMNDLVKEIQELKHAIFISKIEKQKNESSATKND
ncbi:hypothetical protein ACH0BF_22195 [Pseudobacillus sp. 179-B 2D1 NHS]|uniref:hypothetical protein n=1 Tax=Pseudobacillus sp. 179-B 2D1 NHS TaxID=3374292 RepID=UPI003879D54B